MKFNKISMVLAALAFVGCSSEDLNEFAATPAVEDSNLIQLGSDFVLAGVGAEGTTTRTHWEWEDPATKKKLINKFLPIYKSDATFGSTIDKDAVLEAQAVGLCWLGNGATGTDVYTNYEFYHFGWLQKGAKGATFDCGKLTNGAKYDEITATGSTAGTEADVSKFAYASGVTKDFAITKLDYNSGIYKTDNKAIFGGQYIVYYPYNPNFKDAGTIPATAETNWTNVPTALTDSVLGRATFRYSAPVTIKGGSQASDFTLKNLSALVQLRVATPTNVNLSAKEIDQIILYSPSQKLLKQANLAADQIAAGKKGAELYTSTEGTKTISAKFTAPVTLKKTNASPTSAYITVLPTTVDDLVVFVHNSTDKTWATIQKPNTVFEAGNANRLDISVTAADFKSDYIAVDQTSLETALNEARAALNNKNAKKTITVIGDITLTSNLDINKVDLNNTSANNSIKDTQITIKGDDIIVPQNVTLKLATTMQSNVRVLGKSCCSGDYGGRLEVSGGTINNVTLEKTEAKAGAGTSDYDDYNPMLTYNTNIATVAAGKTVDVQAGNVNVNTAVSHKGDIKIAEDVKLTVYAGGDLNFMGSNVTNDGTIEVKANGKFDMTDKNGNATATDGQRMTNNGTFIHNIDAGVGTAVQKMNQNGEYRCRVNEQTKLDDAFLQWTACSVIEMVNTGAVSYNLGTAAGIAPTAYKHNDKYIDIEVNSGDVTTFNNPLDANKKADEKEIMIGNLTVKAGGLDIDYAVDNTLSGNDHKIYKRTLTVNGDMTVEANTTLTSSKKINVTNNLTVEGTGVTLDYKGGKKNENGFAITKDVTVSGATFAAGVATSTATADEVDDIDITCANFYLKKNADGGATAIFGNRTDGAAKNLVVSGTIDNPKDCTFNIVAAGQYNGSVLAWVTCKELKVGGTFSAARPRVE